MIDLHCHMLPGIDDGPKSMDDSLAMARFAVEHGTRHCVVTPHIQPGCYDNELNSIQRVYAEFKDRLAAEEISLEVSMAAEVRVCAELPLMINQNKIPYLGRWQGMNLLLLEFPHDQIPIGVEKLIDWLISRSILPVIAHPERNQSLMRQPEKINSFIQKGCLLQVTAGSITGVFGEVSQRVGLSFIKQGLVTLVASDAHNLHKRHPGLNIVRELLFEVIGDKKTHALLCGNAEMMLS